MQEIPVYRQHQPIWWSPCLLGEPCGICRAHEMRKKLRTPCPLRTKAAPAFTVPAKTAIALVKDGLAVTDPEQTFLQLTFSKIAHLRDRSLKIGENFLLALVADHFPGKDKDEKAEQVRKSRWARAVRNEGWAGTAMLPLKEMRDDGRILSFAP